jgi:hypothetical protein
MFKKMIVSIVVLITTFSNIAGQSSWKFIGPMSWNQLYGNGFETSQMTKVATSTIAPTVVVATSMWGGLWISYTNGNKWDNVDMSPTGLAQAIAVAFKNSNEVLVGNYQNIHDVADQTSFSYSNRVSAYDFSNQTWTNYPLFPANTPSFVIKALATDPLNENIIFAGTSIGLYKIDLTVANPAWTAVVPNCNVASIVFTDNYTCFISGGDLPAVYPAYSGASGTKYMIKVSTNSGNSFSNCTPTPALNIPSNVDSYTELCYGSNGVYVLTRAGDPRYLHYIDGLSYASMSYGTYNNYGIDGDRMAIAYDPQNNDIWFGGQKLMRYSIDESHLYGWGQSPPYNVNYNSFHNGSGGCVHDDIHCLHLNNNKLWVACDGGIAKATIPSPTLSVYSVTFTSMNYSLNVSLINSFSGSEQEPGLYVSGGQDIVNHDVYDEVAGKNRYTHTYETDGDWENDGAFIYKYDDNLMIFDKSFSPGADAEKTMISTSKGQTYDVTYLPYLPDPNASTFEPGVIINFGYTVGGKQRTLQDPFRPGRIYQIGRSSGNNNPGAAIMQYHFNSKKFILKGGCGPWGPFIQDMSFSPSSKNSVYALSNNPGVQAPNVFKFVGVDFDDYWFGHNDVNVWSNITPNFLNFSSIVSGAPNFTSAELLKISLKKIETSPWNKNLIYVAGIYGYPGDNSSPGAENRFNYAKVLKYDGTNWTNYSVGIPTTAVVYSMIMDHYSNDALYLSTSAGVYYKDASMSNWVAYSNGLQNMETVQMEINYKENTVRLGTFGYGIWKSQLQCPSTSLMNLTFITAPGVYQANTINSYADNDLLHGPVALRGTNSISFLPGFKANPGTSDNQYLFAFIHGCGPGSSSSPYLFRSGPEAENELKAAMESLNDFELFPNPNNGSFTLQFNGDGEKEIEVLDIMGRKVKEFETEGLELQINLTDLKKGIYFVKVQTENKKMTKKVVVQ